MASGAASNWRYVLLLVLASSSTVHALTPSQVFDAVKDSVVVINPKDAGTWKNLAITYYQSGNTPAALQAVKTLRTLDPAQAEKLFNVIVPR